MEQSRSTRFILIILILALGLFVEVLKGIRRAHMAGSHQTLILEDADVSPFHISDQQMVADRIAARERAFANRGMHLMGEPAKTQSYDFSGGRVVKSKETAKVTKKKKVTKIKKKKKKKTNNQISEIPYQQYDAQATPRADSNQSPAVPANSGVQTGAPTAGKRPTGSAVGGIAGNNDTKQSGYSQWAAELLPTTNQATVIQFVQSYQHNLVSEADFYALLDAMSAEAAPNEQLLALYAANATPSVQSFSFLVSALKTDAANTSVVNAADQYLDSYSTLNQVPILKQVFSQSLSDEATIQIASDVLGLSTTTYIGSRTPTSASGQPNASAANLVTAYSGFIPILERAITAYAKNPTISANLQKSLALIKTIEPPTTSG